MSETIIYWYCRDCKERSPLPARGISEEELERNENIDYPANMRWDEKHSDCDIVDVERLSLTRK